MRAIKRLYDGDCHQLTDDCQAAKPKQVTEIDAAFVRYSMHRGEFHLKFQISLMVGLSRLPQHLALSRTGRPGRIHKMTNSPSSRPNQLLSEAPQTGADQDSIIPRALNAFIDQARSANAQGNQVERAVWLQAALMLQSDRPETGLDLIDAMLKQNRIGDGIQLAAQLVDRHPQHALALWHLGYALQLANRHTDAIPFYERAHAINPAVPTLRNNLAVAYELTGSEDKALTMLEEAVAANADDIEAWTNLTRVYPRRLQLEHALAAGKRAVEINPSNALALSNYSLALKEAQRWPEATEAAKTAADIAPGMARLPFNLSILDLVQGNYARGWANFETRWNGSSELRNSHPNFAMHDGTGNRCATRPYCCGASKVSATRCNSRVSSPCWQKRFTRRAAR